MKITTQRSLIWGINFAIVAAMFGLLVLMVVRHGKDQRRRYKTEQIKALNDELARVKPPERKSRTRERILKTVLTKNFAGWVPPPKPEPKPDRTAGQAPKLETFLDVIFTVAPTYDSKGELTNKEQHGVTVRLKNLSAPKNIFFYRQGDTIGIGEGGRADADPKLKQFGGAKIERILPDAIVCRWAQREERVELGGWEDPGGISVSGGGINVGKIDKKSANAVAGAAPGSSGFGIFQGNPRGRSDYLKLSPDGVTQIQSRGEALLEGVTFETARSDRNEKALKLKTIPDELSKYGLQPGDVITHIDGRPVSSKESIIKHVRETYSPRKSTYRVTYLREGQVRFLTVQVPRGAAGRQALRNRFRDAR